MNYTYKSIALTFMISLFIQMFAYTQISRHIELAEGILIDREKRIMYVLNDRDKTEAVDIRQGKIIWSLDNGYYPLALVGDTLMAQVNHEEGTTMFKWAMFDVVESAQLLESDSISLLGSGSTRLDTVEIFKIYTDFNSLNKDILISWQYANPIREYRRHEFSTKNLEITPQERYGALRFDLITLQTNLLDYQSEAFREFETVEVPDESMRIQGVSGRQFYSIDRAHILISNHVSGNERSKRYKWEIFSPLSDEKIGEVYHDTSFIPFVILDGKILFEIGPSTVYLPDGTTKNLPGKIRSVDLKNNNATWEISIKRPKIKIKIPPR